MDLPREIAFSKTRAPAVAPALKLAVRERIAQCVRKAHAYGIRLPMPTVSFDLRGKTAGQAYRVQNHVRLNAVLLTENAAHFIEQTVGHEVAHLVTRYKYGEKVESHGPQWRAVMVAFGLEPRRCHSYDVSNAVVGKTYAFACGCAAPHVLGARRAKAALRGAYRCSRCGLVLKHASQAVALAPSGAPKPAATLTQQPSTKISPRATAAAVGSSGPRAPTIAMLKYAQDLATKIGLKLPSAVEKDFTVCSQFIEQAKRHLAPTPPTERQLAFAQRMAEKLGKTIPAATLASRQALSQWLDQHLSKSA